MRESIQNNLNPVNGDYLLIKQDVS